MKKHLYAGLTAVALVTMAACSDAPSAPSVRAATPNPIAAFDKGSNGKAYGKGKNDAHQGGTSTSSADSLLTYLSSLHDTLSRTVQPVMGIKRLSPLSGAQSASALIGAEGGMVALPTAGAYLWVPPGAVHAPTTFSMTARPGRAAAYDFQPAGAVFDIPLVLIQDRSLLSAAAPIGFNSGALAYYSKETDVDATTANATASQVRLPMYFSTAQYFAFPVWHFSGYIVSWGRD